MKARALVCLLWLFACEPKAGDSDPKAPPSEPRPKPESEAPPTAPTSALTRDLDRICNAEEQSGALDLPEGDRALHTGIWLANEIELQESRDFVAVLKALDTTERIKRLREKLDQHKMGRCEIIKTWGGDAFDEIAAGQRLPTFAEIGALSTCGFDLSQLGELGDLLPSS